MMYLVTTPQWFKWIYPTCIWRINTDEKAVYLSFDDGPHPVATPFVLNELRKYNAKATFFCLGKNVQAYPEIYRQIIEEGHAVGNHTFNHKNGWKTDSSSYIKDIQQAADYIDSKLFRPPYGRITRFAAKVLKEQLDMEVIMWDVLSGDFDTALSVERCRKNVLNNVREGSIVVFHDSEKAWPLLNATLPEVLKRLSDKGFSFKSLHKKRAEG